MTDREVNEGRPIFREDEPPGEGAPDPDIVPEGALRGGITVPDANDTGITTPPISGWGEIPADNEDRVDRGWHRRDSPRDPSAETTEVVSPR